MKKKKERELLVLSCLCKASFLFVWVSGCLSGQVPGCGFVLDSPRYWWFIWEVTPGSRDKEQNRRKLVAASAADN